MRHAVILACLGVILAGCSEPDLHALPVAGDPSDLDRHLVVVDSRGEADRSGLPVKLAAQAKESCAAVLAQAPDDPALQLRQRFVCIVQSAIEHYQTWFEKSSPPLVPDPVFKLVLYFNGGLNTPADAMATAAASYLQAESDRLYPIYMVWPTGPLGTYGEDLLHVRSGRYLDASDPQAASSTPVRPLSDLARGIAGTPAAWGGSLIEYWQSGFGLGNAAYGMAIDEKVLVPPKGTVALGQNLYFDAGTAPGSDVINADSTYRNAGEGVQKTAGYLYYGAMGPVRMLTTPLVVGLGEPGWRNMVRRTRTSVRAVDEFPPELAGAAKPASGLAVDCAHDPELSQSYAKLQHCYPRGAGGFSRFFQWLESCLIEASTKPEKPEQPEKPLAAGADGCPLTLSTADRKILRRVRITMIGHSMGTIVVNELLQLYPNLPYENLVYMAAAASTRDTARAVVPVLRRNQGCTKLYGLMLHPLNESRESTAGGVLLSGSLLSYVDELLENPKTLPDRTFGQWHNVRMTEQMFPEDVQRWMLFRVFDREAATYSEGGKLYRRANPTTHDMFNDANMPFWQETSFWRPEGIVFAPPDRESCEALFTDRIADARTAANLPSAK